MFLNCGVKIGGFLEDQRASHTLSLHFMCDRVGRDR